MTARPTWTWLGIAALIAVAGACEKQGGEGLLLVNLTSAETLSDVQRLDVTLKQTAAGGKTSTLAFDGKGTMLSSAAKTLGVNVSGQAGPLAVSVRAFGNDNVPLGSGQAADDVTPRAGEVSQVDIQLHATGEGPDGGTPDGEAPDGPTGDAPDVTNADVAAMDRATADSPASEAADATNADRSPTDAVDALPAGGDANASACMSSNWTIVDNNPTAPPAYPVTNAIDGNPATRYTTGRSQQGVETVTLIFPSPVSITGLNLFVDSNDFPVTYAIKYSTNALTYSDFSPPATGPGVADLTIPLPRTTMRALRILQTGTSPSNWWSINELTIQGCQPE